jgi:hypothetical protein
MNEKPETGWLTLEEAVPVDLLKAEVRAWAWRIGVEPREIRVRPMKNKWASCSTHGRLTFDQELLYKPADFRARVIVHELLHLKVPNHGRVFRALVKAYLDEAGVTPNRGTAVTEVAADLRNSHEAEEDQGTS